MSLKSAWVIMVNVLSLGKSNRHVSSGEHFDKSLLQIFMQTESSEPKRYKNMAIFRKELYDVEGPIQKSTPYSASSQSLSSVFNQEKL